MHNILISYLLSVLREKIPSPSNIDTRLDQDNTATDLQDEPPADIPSLSTTQEETSIRHSRHKFGLCHGGRSSLDTKLEEKRCFISTV